MVNVDLLRGKIVEKRMKAVDIADKLGMDKSTFYRRLSEFGGTFTIGEADKIANTLGLTAAEAMAIFFSQFVA